MTDCISFVIPGNPVGKGRPRFVRRENGVQTYTPDKTVEYEKLVRGSFEAANSPKEPFYADKDIPLKVTIVSVFKPPKNETKEILRQKLSGRILPTKKPDCDNIIKCILDALNGLAYDDDSQVVDVACSKMYGAVPATRVTMEAIKWDG